MRDLANGEDVIVLSIGDPDFDTPAPIVEAAIESLRAGRTHYSEAGGIQPLREAIARNVSRRSAREISAERVVFLPGAQAALFAVCLCVLEPGDEVITPDPTYVTYEAVIGSTDAGAIRVPLRAENRFHLRPEDVEASITPRTRALLINNPHNPTGAALTAEEIEALGELCRRHDLWLIADEVYADLTYDRPHVSPLSFPALDDRVAVVSSLSKSHAMTGWRHGWAVGPEELAHHLHRLAICMLYGSPRFIQDAGCVALSEPLPELEMMRLAYMRRAEILLEGLAGAPGISCYRPEAGMFVLVDVRRTGLDGWSFAEGLFEAEGVSTLPGEGFGANSAGHVRISLAVEDERLMEACRRITRYARGLARSEVSMSTRGDA